MYMYMYTIDSSCYFYLSTIFYPWILIYRSVFNMHVHLTDNIFCSFFFWFFFCMYKYRFDVNLSSAFTEEPCSYWLTVTMFRWDVYIYIYIYLSEPWSILRSQATAVTNLFSWIFFLFVFMLIGGWRSNNVLLILLLLNYTMYM